MDILLQSDGQLYPPRHAERKAPKPAPKPEPKPVQREPEPPPPPLPEPVHKSSQPPAPIPALPWEEFLIGAVALIVMKSGDTPDIPLLLALAYILFDSNFSLKGLL